MFFVVLVDLLMVMIVYICFIVIDDVFVMVLVLVIVLICDIIGFDGLLMFDDIGM